MGEANRAKEEPGPHERGAEIKEAAHEVQRKGRRGAQRRRGGHHSVVLLLHE